MRNEEKRRKVIAAQMDMLATMEWSLSARAAYLSDTPCFEELIMIDLQICERF